MAVLLGMVAALVGGMSIAAVLAGLTLPDWIALAGLLISAGEEAIKIFVKLHPALAVLEEEMLEKSRSWLQEGVTWMHEDLERIAGHAAQLSFVPPSDDPSQLAFVPEN